MWSGPDGRCNYRYAPGGDWEGGAGGEGVNNGALVGNAPGKLIQLVILETSSR